MSTKEITMTYKKVELVKTDIIRIFKRSDKKSNKTKPWQDLGRYQKHETRTSSYNEEQTENK